MKNIPIQHISEIINSYLQDRSWMHRIEGYSVLKTWDDIVPKNISMNIKPIKIQDHF
ncbi:MAG: DUF721 domain-containing protein, partial [Ignavibacteriales bacterium]|nr:DUF721 domain-containing protein [Ignavibacteriales bacterium]